MSDAFTIAELLEEIARNADAPSIMHRSRIGMFTDKTQSSVGHSIHFSPQRKTVIFTIYVSVELAMKGVTGSPDEVLEWLSTGPAHGQRVYLHEIGGEPHFAIEQTHVDNFIYDQILSENTKFDAKVQEFIQQAEIQKGSEKRRDS